MSPAPLNVPASPSPNKTPKASGPSVNGTTKQPTPAKNLAPSDISSPHELTAFVRFRFFEPVWARWLNRGYALVADFE